MTNAEKLARLTLLYFNNKWDQEDSDKWRELTGSNAIGFKPLTALANLIVEENMK